jgi:anti-sigma factor RsiW
MDCKQCAEDLTAYLDGELSPNDSAQVKSHLAVCASCADEMRSFERAADFVETHRLELSLRPGSWNAVRAQLPVEKASPSLFGFAASNRWRAAFAAVACIVILTVGYLWQQQIQERSLNAYISQYIKAREAGRLFNTSIAGIDAGFGSRPFAAENPFIEAKVGPDFNPFRSEDR